MNPLIDHHNTLKSTEIIIKNALESSMDYSAYRELVRKMAESQSNTGSEKNESLAHYTQLNHKRMNRWDKTLKLSDLIIDRVLAVTQPVTWLVLTESWCGDASPSLPVMNKLAELNAYIHLRIVLRDEHPELMDLFLTNGARSIPKLIALDSSSLKVLGEWGPRSKKAKKLVLTEKATYGKIRPEFKQELQVFYNKDKGEAIITELLELLTLK